MSSTKRTSVTWLWAVAALLLPACAQTTAPQAGRSPGGAETPETSAGATKEVDACDLLTLGEVTAETGYQLEEPSSSRTKSQCPWSSADPDSPQKRVLLEASLTDQSADDLISARRENMSGGGRSVTSVSGVGDDALLVTGEDTGPFAEVYAVKASGGQTAALRLIIGGEPDKPFDSARMSEAAKTLTKTAISRLPG
jgi:hypothetical protein